MVELESCAYERQQVREAIVALLKVALTKFDKLPTDCEDTNHAFALLEETLEAVEDLG